jgi:hypothetical protein
LVVYPYGNRKRSKRKGTAYKNIHHRVIILRDLKLIEEVEKQSNRGAKYYRLSVGGIYYLIHDQMTIFMSLIKEVLQNYCNNIIFNAFIFPYFMPSTVLGVKDTNIISKICIYLHDCLVEIERLLKFINNPNRFTEEVFIWQDVPGLDNIRLVDFLKRKFNLDWIDNAEITKFEDGKTIKISKRSNSVLIKLAEENRAVLTINRGNPYELMVTHHTPEWLAVGDPSMTVREFEIRFSTSRLDSLLSSLIGELVLGVGHLSESDSQLLSQDLKFMRSAKITKEIINYNYQKLIFHKKS